MPSHAPARPPERRVVSSRSASVESGLSVALAGAGRCDVTGAGSGFGAALTAAGSALAGGGSALAGGGSAAAAGGLAAAAGSALAGSALAGAGSAAAACGSAAATAGAGVDGRAGRELAGALAAGEGIGGAPSELGTPVVSGDGSIAFPGKGLRLPGRDAGSGVAVAPAGFGALSGGELLLAPAIGG